MRHALIPALALLLLAPTASLAKKPKLSQRVEALEAKVAELEAQLAAPSVEQSAEQAAMALYKQASDAVRGGDTDRARELLQQIEDDHGATRVAQAASRLADQVAVVGKRLESLDVERWLSGEATLGDGLTLVVFWEAWCPHCRREIPKIQEVWTRYGAAGLDVVSLTKLSRDTAPEDLLAFAQEHGVTYPIGHEDGHLSDFFGVSGVPAAAVLRGREVIWRGHPAQLDDAMFASWLGQE